MIDRFHGPVDQRGVDPFPGGLRIEHGQVTQEQVSVSQEVDRRAQGHESQKADPCEQESGHPGCARRFPGIERIG